MKTHRLTAAIALALLAVAALAPPASRAAADPQSAADDIEARCDGSTPVVTSRPPGTEDIAVICVDGLPEFVVSPQPVPVYDPIKQPLPQVIPPDFAAWVTVWLNGRPLKTPYNPVRGIQEPGAWLAASTGRVMMPVRFFTEAFGGQVQWFADERRVHLALPSTGKSVDLWPGAGYAKVNDQFVKLDQPPMLFADRTFVPVRFLTESLGARVQWDQFSRSARVDLDGAACVSSLYCGEVR